MIEIYRRTALVTGGGSGIGRSLALALASEGARVLVADIMPHNASAVAEEICANGGTAMAVHCDVCDKEMIERVKAEAHAAYGPVSLLFANAGATSFECLTDMSENDINWIVQVNLMGVIHCLTTFLPDMIAAQAGHVVATSSAAGLLPSWIPFHSPYSAAKMGIIGLMLNLRYELEKFGVGATVLCPFGVETTMKYNNQLSRPERFGGPGREPIKLGDGVVKATAVKFRSPDEVAQMVLRAVRENRAMVVTDPSQRQNFEATYVKCVMDAFNDAEAFDREQA